MTRDEILSAAYSVGTVGEPWWLDDDDLIEFATKILAVECEACARIAFSANTYNEAARLIRMRSDVK